MAIRSGLNFLNEFADHQQVVRQVLRFRVNAHNLQPAIRLLGLKIDAPAAGISEQLAAALLIADQQGTFASRCAACQKVCHQQRLSGARRATDKGDAVAEESTATHPIEFGIAARHTRGAGLLLEPQ